MLKTKAGRITGHGTSRAPGGRQELPPDQPPAPTLQKLLRRREVIALTGLPTSTIYEQIARGEFPRPIRISPRLVAWLETEVLAWQAARIAERDARRREAA